MRERRKNFRVEWNSSAKIYDVDGRFYGLCIVSNFSNGGARILGVEANTVPDEFVLHIVPRIRPQRCKVVRRKKDGIAAIFTDTFKATSEPKAARLRRSAYKRSERPQQWA